MKENVARAAFLSAASQVAKLKGLDVAQVLAPPVPDAVSKARRLAIYLAVTQYGVGQSQVARAAGVTKQAVHRSLAVIEDARERRELARLLQELGSPA